VVLNCAYAFAQYYINRATYVGNQYQASAAYRAAALAYLTAPTTARPVYPPGFTPREYRYRNSYTG